MGLRVPKRNNIEQWKKIEQLFLAGYRFPMTSDQAPRYPDKLSEVRSFIEENPNHPFRQKL